MATMTLQIGADLVISQKISRACVQPISVSARTACAEWNGLRRRVNRQEILEFQRGSAALCGKCANLIS